MVGFGSGLPLNLVLTGLVFVMNVDFLCFLCPLPLSFVLMRKKMKNSLHKKKLSFLNGKRLFLRCLKQGHMSKLNCEGRLLTHPTVCHMKNNNITLKEESSAALTNGLLDTTNKTCAGTGASNTDNILTITSVRVKEKKATKWLLHMPSWIQVARPPSVCSILLTTMG